MRVRLHEIELGVDDIQESTAFFEKIIGGKPSLQQQELTVFDTGIKGLDSNLSQHLLAGVAAISFLTDDLHAVEERLKAAAVTYEGPRPSHLGMTCIQFTTPEGYVIKINTPGPNSPAWLKV